MMGTENKSKPGEMLKQGRLRQRLSLSECAKRTHISVRYLEALEEEHWNDLPSESHRLGFKLYCRFLGVSVDDVLALYNQRTEAAHGAREKSTPRRRRNRKTSRTRAGYQDLCFNWRAWSFSSSRRLADLPRHQQTTSRGSEHLHGPHARPFERATPGCDKAGFRDSESARQSGDRQLAAGPGKSAASF